ncbi:MAG: carbohydrate kinase family protein [Promethearchaeota archaeon]
MADVIAIGELLIDLIADNPSARMEDQTTFKRFAGGAPANFIVGIKKLGFSAGLISKVGDDFFGRFLIETLEKEGIDISQIIITNEYKTALAFVGLDELKRPSFSFYRSPCADIMLKESEINTGYIKSAKLLMYGTVSIADEPARSAVKKAVHVAKQNDVLVACDPNLRDDLWHHQDPREYLLELLEMTDIFLPSLSEVELITGKKEEKAIEAIFEIGPKVIGVTSGEKGSRIITKEKTFFAPSFNVPVMDTTGAGDAFAAGMITGLLLKLNMNNIPYFANAVSALKIMKKGAMSLPTMKEVTDFLKQRKIRISNL